jgi:hypothetical protein
MAASGLGYGAAYGLALSRRDPISAPGVVVLSLLHRDLGRVLQQTGPAPHNLTWNTIPLTPYSTAAADVEREINELIELIDYRPGVMAEALRQRDDMLAYWCGVLMFSKASHPLTYDLMEIALRVGQFQAMHYKLREGRPRPSQLSPALMPPIEVPGHASLAERSCDRGVSHFALSDGGHAGRSEHAIRYPRSRQHAIAAPRTKNCAKPGGLGTALQV